MQVMSELQRDMWHSTRMLLKSPGFTITALATVALGIGATTAIFSLINAVLLKPLPVFESDRFVMLMTTEVSETGGSRSDSDASPLKFELWRAQTSVIQFVSAFLPGVMNYTEGDVVEQLRSMQASADFFRCWGIRIVRGRTFTPEEDLPHGARVALISQDLWKRRFASDPQILDRTISLNDEPYSVIGILADSPGLREFGPPSDVYVPFQFDPNTRDEGNYFKVVARLKPGVTLKQANDRLQAVANNIRAEFPNTVGQRGSFTVTPFREARVGDIRHLLLVLLSAVGLVLLIACANVANLLLVRGTIRRREIAIRSAIGAGRQRLIRQLLSESVLLSLVGGALGFLLGYGGIRALLSVNTTDLPLVGQNGSEVSIDWRVMGFALALSFVTGIVFGVFPALQASSVDLNSLLKENSTRSGTGLRQNKARAALVVSETSFGRDSVGRVRADDPFLRCVISGGSGIRD
jgi:putative ABC transport system permease protein